jgi:hypothetical protein
LVLEGWNSSWECVDAAAVAAVAAVVAVSRWVAAPALETGYWIFLRLIQVHQSESFNPYLHRVFRQAAPAG